MIGKSLWIRGNKLSFTYKPKGSLFMFILSPLCLSFLLCEKYNLRFYIYIKKPIIWWVFCLIVTSTGLPPVLQTKLRSLNEKCQTYGLLPFLFSLRFLSKLKPRSNKKTAHILWAVFILKWPRLDSNLMLVFLCL